jgi:hypothetical protein
MSSGSTADSLRERLSVAWGEGYTTSMSTDCKTGCIDEGVEAVVNVEVVDSAVFLGSNRFHQLQLASEILGLLKENPFQGTYTLCLRRLYCH